MVLGLAERSALQSTLDASLVAFATLAGPICPERRQAPNDEKRLLATIAHELRSPLASLRLSLEMLASDYDELEPAAAMRLIQRAQRSSRWLQTMTEDLTSAACVEAGQLNTRCEVVDLLTCLHEATSLVEGLLTERRQTVRITSSASCPLGIADADRTIQVVANLLTNASRYSVKGDEIELDLSQSGDQLRVRVTDHGPGISARDQQRIFDAWVRGAAAPSGGLGLGLSIVHSLVHQQGGRVGVESILEQGATFWFTVPAAGCDALEAISACCQ